MNAQDYWKIFLETGAPEMYLLYSRERRMEETHVFDHTGTGASYHGLS